MIGHGWFVWHDIPFDRHVSDHEAVGQVRSLSF